MRKPADIPTSEHDEPVDPGGLPQQTVEQEELLGALRASIETLPALDRKMIALYFGAGLKQHEIGAELSISQRTVSFHIDEALGRLRAHLTRSGYAAALPLVASDSLGQALCSGSAPNLTAKVLARVGTAGDLSRRLIPAGKAGSSGFLAAGAAALVLLAGGALWLVLAKKNSPPAAPAAVIRGGDASPAPEAAAAEGAPQAKLFHARWRFDTGPAAELASIRGRDATLHNNTGGNLQSNDDLPVMKGAWRWKPGANGKPGAMFVEQNQAVWVRLPIKIPQAPLLVRLRVNLEGHAGNVHGMAIPLENGAPGARTFWNNVISMPSGQMDINTYIVGAWSIQYIDKDVFAMRRFKKPYPGDEIAIRVENADLYEIELRELRPDEIPSDFSAPEKVAATMAKGPAEIPGILGDVPPQSSPKK